MSFSGVFYHSLDPKNRVFIPANFREALGENFYIFKSTEKCLYLYDAERWQELIGNLENDSDNPLSRKKQRLLFKRVANLSMDKQGRITIGSDFIEHAGLKKDVVVFGVGSRIEIWDLDEWSKLDSEDDEDMLSSGIVF